MIVTKNMLIENGSIVLSEVSEDNKPVTWSIKWPLDEFAIVFITNQSFPYLGRSIQF